MAEIAVGKGNWANASARSKARKAKLLDETRLRQLMKSGPDTIAASIGSSTIAGNSTSIRPASVGRTSLRRP
ncbi:MAG: hypothetical protein CM1200mP32_07850 [Methanobacteriota archaeon]|nr:MAG: hypothetical protein CM1200mP32_07850 [Euryarchaeota archaeon]